MANCVAVLTVSADKLSDGSYIVAVDGDDCLLGVTRIERLDEDGTFELDKLFIDPNAMGLGVGRALFDRSMEMAQAADAKRIEILSDPDAAPFYERMGAKRIGEAPSDAIPGRMLPLLEIRL